MEPLTRTLVHFSHALKLEDLSGEIVHQTKCLRLDYLGVTVAGTLTESAQAVCRMTLNDTYNLGSDPCTIIGTSARSSPERAALANGTASHSVEQLAITHDLHPEQISRVEIAVLEAGWPLVREPRQRKYSPSSIVDVQFSMPFAAALVLSYRQAGLDQFADENLKSAQLQSLMSKVVMIKDKRIEKNLPAEWATRVKVQLTNGDEFEKVVRFPKGDAEDQLSWQELTTKFQSLAMCVFPQSWCQEIVDSVCEMNHFTALTTIWKLMAHPTPATAAFRRTAPAARGS